MRLNTIFDNEAKGSFVRSLLHINARDLKFTTSRTEVKSDFDILAVSFGDNGQVVDQIGKSYYFNVKAAGYEDVLKNGFFFFSFPVKKPARINTASPSATTARKRSLGFAVYRSSRSEEKSCYGFGIVGKFHARAMGAYSNDAPKTKSDFSTNPTMIPRSENSSAARFCDTA